VPRVNNIVLNTDRTVERDFRLSVLITIKLKYKKQIGLGV
jgi:hypothetical protein